MEEMCVITIDFLAKLDILSQDNLRVNIEVDIVEHFCTRPRKVGDDGYRITQVRESDTSGVRSMRHLACVPTGKEEGLVRLQRVNFKDLLNVLHGNLF